MRSKPQDEVAENEQEMAAAVINAAKKTLISQVVKRNVIENIVPIVISLKHMVSRYGKFCTHRSILFTIEYFVRMYFLTDIAVGKAEVACSERFNDVSAWTYEGLQERSQRYV